MIITPYCFHQKTRCAIDAKSTLLCLQDEDAERELCQMLGRENKTRLVLSNGVHHEIVEVSCECGELAMQRAMEGTVRLCLPACSVVKFELTPGLSLLMQERIKADLAEDPTCEGKVNGMISDTLQLTQEEDDETCTRIELPECEEITWCTPGWIYTFKDGCITREVDATTILKDGVVKNPTLCFKDGKLIRVEPGDLPSYGEGCGTCNTCDGCGCTACTGVVEVTGEVK